MNNFNDFILERNDNKEVYTKNGVDNVICVDDLVNDVVNKETKVRSYKVDIENPNNILTLKMGEQISGRMSLTTNRGASKRLPISGISNVSMGRICNMLNLPTAYVAKSLNSPNPIVRETAAHVLKTGMIVDGHKLKGCQAYVYDNGDDKILKGFVGPRFVRINAENTLVSMLKFLKENGFIPYRGTYDDGIGYSMMFIQPEKSFEVAGQKWTLGVTISNRNDGLAAFTAKITPICLFCMNGIIFKKEKAFNVMNERHFSEGYQRIIAGATKLIENPKEIVSNIVDIFNNALTITIPSNESARHLLESYRSNKKNIINDILIEDTADVKVATLTDTQIDNIMRFYEGKYGDQPNAYGLAQAITDAAHAEVLNSNTESMEALGGQIMLGRFDPRLLLVPQNNKKSQIIVA